MTDTAPEPTPTVEAPVNVVAPDPTVTPTETTSSEATPVVADTAPSATPVDGSSTSSTDTPDSTPAEADPSWEPADPTAATATPEASASPADPAQNVVAEQEAQRQAAIDAALNESDPRAIREAQAQNLPTREGAPLNSYALDILTGLKDAMASIEEWHNYIKAQLSKIDQFKF